VIPGVVAEAPQAPGLWRRTPGIVKMLGALVVFCAVVLAVGAATRGGSARTAAPAVTPISCLHDQGLTQVSERSAGFWRGFHQLPFFMVSVTAAGSAREARTDVAQADLVTGAAAGRYAVFGPSVSFDDGGVVADVADCLGG
jgi:hypothetical protein